jgi:hypothetical protein
MRIVKYKALERIYILEKLIKVVKASIQILSIRADTSIPKICETLIFVISEY